jgi:AGCS family alanine or glycine:cation symporter
MLRPFIDTIVLCPLTGLVIVSTGAWETGKTSTSLSIYSLMPIPNLIGLLLLNKIVVGRLKDYFKS